MAWTDFDWPLFGLYLATVAIAAATGVMFRPGRWYQHLSKPRWTPPNWMFPTVWTALYIMMAIAAARIAGTENNALALSLWGLQIMLNAMWSPVFFGLHHIRAGLAILVLLWLSVAATIAVFLQADHIAAALMAPYLLWVTVAFALNWAVISLNPDANVWKLG